MQAHDDLVAAAYCTQADALEYDAAQERGEVAEQGDPRPFKVEGLPTVSDIGLESPQAPLPLPDNSVMRPDRLLVPIDQIRIGDRLRKAEHDRVASIADSIAEHGLHHPISVAAGERWQDGKCIPCFDLVAGLHRLLACQSLGRSEIEVDIMAGNEIDRMLWECDENLARAELSDVAEARFLARRKELYEIKHPETRKGVAQAAAMNEVSATDVADKLSATSFAADTAAKTGATERTVRRKVRRAEQIVPDVLDRIEGTPRDRGVVLDQLAKMEPPQQRAVVRQMEQGKPLPSRVPQPARPAEITIAGESDTSVLIDGETKKLSEISDMEVITRRDDRYIRTNGTNSNQVREMVKAMRATALMTGRARLPKYLNVHLFELVAEADKTIKALGALQVKIIELLAAGPLATAPRVPAGDKPAPAPALAVHHDVPISAKDDEELSQHEGGAE